MLTQGQIQAAWAPRCRGPWLTINLHGEGRVTVRPAIGDAVLALDACLRRWDYRTRRADTGAYNCRLKTSGNGWSMHSYATAPDINWTTNPYSSRLRTDMPIDMVRAICAIRTRNGQQVWNWGGFWSGNKDAMHFEIVCRPSDIATGIDPSTVPGGTASRPPTSTPTPGPTPAAPDPQSEEDEMYARNTENGEIWHIAGENARHIGPKSWAKRNEYARKWTGKGIPVVDMHPWVLADLVIGSGFIKLPVAP